MESQKYNLNELEWQKLWVNFMIFVSPIAIMYLSAVSAIISMPDHIFSFNDLIPNSILTGMIMKQLIDTSIDIFRKWSDGV